MIHIKRFLEMAAVFENNSESELRAQLREASILADEIKGKLEEFRSMTLRNPDFDNPGRLANYPNMSHPKETIAYSWAKAKGIVPQEMLDQERALMSQLVEANKERRRIEKELRAMMPKDEDPVRPDEEFSDLIRGMAWRDQRDRKSRDDEEEPRDPSRTGTDPDGLGPGAVTPRKKTPYRRTPYRG